jgi:prophage regulatory protein
VHVISLLEHGMQKTILRRPATCKGMGLSFSTLYRRMNAGLFPRSVVLGERAVGWPESEVEAVKAAMIAGQSDEDIRALVARLHTARYPDGEKAPGAKPVLRPVRRTPKGGTQK